MLSTVPASDSGSPLQNAPDFPRAGARCTEFLGHRPAGKSGTFPSARFPPDGCRELRATTTVSLIQKTTVAVRTGLCRIAFHEHSRWIRSRKFREDRAACPAEACLCRALAEITRGEPASFPFSRPCRRHRRARATTRSGIRRRSNRGHQTIWRSSLSVRSVLVNRCTCARGGDGGVAQTSTVSLTSAIPGRSVNSMQVSDDVTASAPDVRSVSCRATVSTSPVPMTNCWNSGRSSARTAARGGYAVMVGSVAPVAGCPLRTRVSTRTSMTS